MAQTLPDHEALLDMMAANQEAEAGEPGRAAGAGVKFPAHLAEAALQRGIKAGNLYQGVFRANR